VQVIIGRSSGPRARLSIIDVLFDLIFFSERRTSLGDPVVPEVESRTVRSGWSNGVASAECNHSHERRAALQFPRTRYRATSALFNAVGKAASIKSTACPARIAPK